MMNESPTVKIDPLLEPLLRLSAGDDGGGGQADELVAGLIADHAEPVIKGVIRHKLYFSFHRADGQSAEAEDVYQEALVQLLAQLRQLRERPGDYPIVDWRGMAAIIAHRVCSRRLRRQFPERHALKNRLHYLLTRQRGLALWQEVGDGKTVAGFAAWRGRMKTVTAKRLERLSADEELLSRARAIKSGRPQELGDALAAVFDFLGGPVEFDELVGALAALLGIKDQFVESIDGDEDPAAFRTAAGGQDTAWQVEKRIFLQKLWAELCQLPPNQRAALLLNLKDADGGGCITLFPATGVATLRQLADALGMSAERFAELWNDLPLDDLAIAALLGLTRQQVINARKSGRERLARRLKGFI